MNSHKMHKNHKRMLLERHPFGKLRTGLAAIKVGKLGTCLPVRAHSGRAGGRAVTHRQAPSSSKDFPPTRPQEPK